MRNVFGINVTNDKDNTEFDGVCFNAREVSALIRGELDSAFETNNEFVKKASLPLWLDIIKLIFMFFAIILTLGELKADVSLKESWNNAPYLIIGCIISWICFLAILIYEKKKQKKIVQSEEFEDNTIDLNEISVKAMEDLGIPTDAKSIDVISDKYKLKDDNIKQVNYHPFYSHMNLDCFIFASNGMLCLADSYNVYEIPLASITSIEESKKRAMFPCWNKDEDYNSKKYKKYKITMNNQGTYFASYFKVIINDIRGEFMLLIPNYDQPLFSEITGIYPK